MCVNTAEELYYKTRSTSRSISTLLCVNTAEELFYKSRSTTGSISTLLCVCQYCRGALQKEHQWYIYPVVCVNTAEELFYTTRSTSGSIPTLLCVLIQQRSSSTRQGAPVGVYLPCCVCFYCRGALLHDKEHQWEYTYPFVCVNTAEELFYKTRSTSRSISTLLGVVILQRSSFKRQGAPVGVYLPCCVCKYYRGALLQDKEHH